VPTQKTIIIGRPIRWRGEKQKKRRDAYSGYHSGGHSSKGARLEMKRAGSSAKNQPISQSDMERVKVREEDSGNHRAEEGLRARPGPEAPLASLVRFRKARERKSLKRETA